MTDKIKVLLADDHAVVREGLHALLLSEPNIEVIGQAKHGAEAVGKCRALQPDVLLLDLVMPRMDGLEVIENLQVSECKTRILVLTSFAEDDKVFKAIKTGALGYLLKDSSPDELIAAIHNVHRGESSLHPTIARKLIREINQGDQPANPPGEALTDREVDVLVAVAKGMSNQEIAEALFIGERTVRTHVSNILGKLHLANRTQAALYALREGYISLDETDA